MGLSRNTSFLSVESDTGSQSPTPTSHSLSVSDAKVQQEKDQKDDKDNKHPGEEEEDSSSKENKPPVKEEDDKNSKQSNGDENNKKSQVRTEGIVQVKDEIVRPKLKRSFASESSDDRTPEGFIRRVAVSPARKDPTKFIHIRGLKRPCSDSLWKEFVAQFGVNDDEDHWMNRVKCHAIIRFSTVEEAVKAREVSFM
jgi:hypothetical protein